jgi:hypothetical protein
MKINHYNTDNRVFKNKLNLPGTSQAVSRMKVKEWEGDYF